MTESDRDILLQTIASKNRIIADLRAAKATLERENAELRACANIDEALGALEDDPDRQTPGQRTWHLYFDGLYNEMPY